MYPIKFKPHYVEKVWGGRNLSSIGKDLPKGNIGESWEISCRKDVDSIISNGKYKGKTLGFLLSERGKAIVGNEIEPQNFPLLIKFLDAQKELSIQVHPDDEYGKKEGDLGKTEAWIVLEANKEANMVLGVKDCTKKVFYKGIQENNLEPYLNRIPIKKGDVFFIKSGLIHTMEGAVVAEIQQNSDLTYRVYDFNRGRELHIDKAMDVIDFSLKGKKASGLTAKEEGYEKTYYCYNDKFSIEKYEIKDMLKEKSDEERFYVYMCIEGSGKIIYEGGEENISKGETILIPASLGEYEFKGDLTLIKTYVPNIEKLEKEILKEVNYM